MKKSTALFALILFLNLNSCIISNPKVVDCEIIEITVSKIKEGPSFDIVFYDNNAEFYYINRGLEQGLNLDALNAKVLNKTVTLHLPKMIYGTSNHIAQLMLGEDIIYSEF